MSDKLSNLDISQNYRDIILWLFPSDLTAALAYWIVRQNPNNTFIADKPVEAFAKYIKPFFPEPKLPTKFNYKQLSDIIDEDVFESIPEILELNEMKPDFIDLGALARNTFYSVLREAITSGIFDKQITNDIINEVI